MIKNILLVILGMGLMFAILSVLKPKGKESKTLGNFKSLAKTPQARNLVKTNEFKNMVKTNEFRKFVLDMGLETLTDVL